MKRKQKAAKNNEIIKGLVKYFNHYWGFIETKNIENKDNIKPDWKTETRYKLEPITLFKRFIDEEKLVGIRFSTNEGSVTKYLMIDLDKCGNLDPRNHPENFANLIETAEEAGLAGYILTSSSWKGGLHLWFGLSKGIPVFDAACFLQKIIENAGFKPKDGHIEPFPNCKGYAHKKIINYKGHRLPLQPNSGSFLLDENLNAISSDFLDFIKALDWTAEKNHVDNEMLEKIKMAREAVYIERVCRSKKGSDVIGKWKADLEFFQEIGWNDFSQTNNLLCKFATYGVVFKGLEGEELEKYVLNIAKETPGYLEFCRHQHNIEIRCKERARNAEKYYWALGAIPRRSGKYKELFLDRNDVSQDPHERSKEAAIYRIKETVNYIWTTETIEIPHSIRNYRKFLIKNIKERHGIGTSERTLTKYPHLWHPNYLGLKLPKKPDLNTEENQKIINSKEQSQITLENTETLQNKDVCHLEQKEKIADLDPLKNKGVCHLPHMKVLKRENGETTESKNIQDSNQIEQELIETEKIESTKVITIQNNQKSQNQKPQKNQLIEITETKAYQNRQENKSESEEKTSRKNLKLITPKSLKDNTSSDQSLDLSKYFENPDFENFDFILESQKPNFKTVEQKLEQTQSMADKVYELVHFTSGLVDFKVKIKPKNKKKSKTIKKTEIRTIHKKKLVIVLDEYHSSSLSENTNPIIVYVKPLDNKDWITGLAVTIDKLKPHPI